MVDYGGVVWRRLDTGDAECDGGGWNVLLYFRFEIRRQVR
jgi:hypothetical protein